MKTIEDTCGTKCEIYTDPNYYEMDIFIDLNTEGYFLEVNSNDRRRYPHFHIKSPDTNENIAISLLKPYYYQHERVTQILHESKIEPLYEFLQSHYANIPYFGDYTVWEWMIKRWNANFPKYHISGEMPDYRKLSKDNIIRRNLIDTIKDKYNA